MWLPRSARDEYFKEAAALAQAVQAVEHYNQELRAIDRDLELVKAADNASKANVPGLRPGYWHLIRRSDLACNVIALEDPETGEPRDPGAWMFDMLKSKDLWNDATQRMHRERQKKILAAAERERDRESQARIDEINDRWYHATHASVSMSPLKRKWAATARRAA